MTKKNSGYNYMMRFIEVTIWWDLLKLSYKQSICLNFYELCLICSIVIQLAQKRKRGILSTLNVLPELNWWFNILIWENSSGLFYCSQQIQNNGWYTVGAASICYWEKLMLLKRELKLLKCQISTNTNRNRFLLPAKCLEVVLKYSY